MEQLAISPTRTCPCCQQVKSLATDFVTDLSRANGKSCYCLSCNKAKYSIWYAKNIEAQRVRNQKRNKQRLVQRKERYHADPIHREQLKRQRRKYRSTPQQQAYAREYARKCRQDPQFRLKNALRCRIHKLLKGSKSMNTMVLIGCDLKALKHHLEIQFQPGMTWDNYGFRSWHIDHIIPCSAFDLSKPEEQRKCFHYTNLQPLWMQDNLAKHNFVPDYQI